jgi:hypothetical protein
MSSAMGLLFSTEGKFFRDFLLDETVRGVDVLSRNALMRLPDLVPGPAGAALQSARIFTPAPLLALVPDLTADEERALRSTQALLDFFLGTPRGHAAPASIPGLVPFGDQASLDKAVQTAESLRPIVQQYGGAMRDFGVQVASRLAEMYTRRALGYTLTVMLPKSQRKNFPDFPEPPVTASGGRIADGGVRHAGDLRAPASSSAPALTDRSVAKDQSEDPSTVKWQERDVAQQVLRTADVVKNHINNILTVEPDWQYYSRNMQLLEPGGTTLTLGRVKQLLGVVRRFIGTFIETEVVDIKTGFVDSLNPVMFAAGTIELSGCNLPMPGNSQFKLMVEGSCKIFFDEQGKVSEVDVDSWSFNGRPIRLPKLDNINSNNLSPQDTLRLLGWTRDALFGR